MYLIVSVRMRVCEFRAGGCSHHKRIVDGLGFVASSCRFGGLDRYLG